MQKTAVFVCFLIFSFVLSGTYVALAQTTQDTTSSTISITTPPRSTPVTGSILIQAQATDNVKVYGVNFYVDGKKINYYEDKYVPYSIYWNSIYSVNGDHSIIAVARDTAGNYAASSPFNLSSYNRKSLTSYLYSAPFFQYNGTTTTQIGTKLTAKLYGTAAGPANYYFYCKSADLSASTSTEPDGKYLNVNSALQSHSCVYPSSGTYYPKVIVERDGAVAQKRMPAYLKVPLASTKFSQGNTVKVYGSTSMKLNVRSDPSTTGALLGTQTYGITGTVIDGPVYSGGYWWWKVDFNSGADGWVAGNYLTKVAATPISTPPAQVQVSGVQAINITPSSASIQWLTDIPAYGQVEFGTSPCPCANTSPWLSYSSAAHVVDLFNLTSNTTYYYRVKSKDAAGAIHVSGNQTFTTISDNVSVVPTTDTTALVISDPHYVNIPDPYSATISWTTNKLATGQIEFGISPCPCSNKTPLVAGLTTNHAINLYNLSPETKYYYRIQSKDAAGNLAVSNLFTLTTHISISNVSIIGPSYYGAHVSGTTPIVMSKNPYVKVAKVELYKDSLNLFKELYATITDITDNGETFVAPFATKTLVDGWYAMRAKIYDTAGDFTVSKEAITVFIDNTQPSASMTAPLSGLTVAKSIGIIYIAASASDNGSLGKIDFYKSSLGGVPSIIDSNSLVGLTASSTEKWFVGFEKEGTYTLYVEVSDRAGNKASSAPVTVTVTAN